MLKLIIAFRIRLIHYIRSSSQFPLNITLLQVSEPSLGARIINSLIHLPSQKVLAVAASGYIEGDERSLK